MLPRRAGIPFRIIPIRTPPGTPRITIEPELQHPRFDLLLQCPVALVAAGPVLAVAARGSVLFPVSIEVLDVSVDGGFGPGVGVLVAGLALVGAVDGGVGLCGGGAARVGAALRAWASSVAAAGATAGLAGEGADESPV